MSIRIYKDNRSPSLTDIIAIDGAAFDLTGSTVGFKMRAEGSSTLKVDGGAVVIPPETNGAVRYDWAAIDVNTAGDYVAWWTVTLPSGKTQDTSEFQVEILEHAESSGWLCGVRDVRETLELPANDTTRDQLIESYIAVCSAHIQRETQREFAPPVTAQARTFPVFPGRTVGGSVLVDLAPYDLRAATLVELHPEESSPSTLTVNEDYVLWPTVSQDGVYGRVVLDSGLSFTSTLHQSFGFCQVRVTGNWGFATVPEQVRMACAETVAHSLRRDFGQLGLDLVEPRDMPPQVPLEVTIPGRARRWLALYRRHSGAF